MYAPDLNARSDILSLHLRVFKEKNGSHASWSSLVGIITAIVGNILISFALNTQRYAHVRIDREYNDGQEKKDPKKRLPRSTHGYGAAAQQEQAAEERERLNAEASGPGNSEDGTNAFGQTQRKKSLASDQTAKHREKDDDSNHGRKSYLKSPYWWVGIILMTIGEAGNFLAYGFAPASIVSTLGVVALISNCLIAPFMLKERFRKRDFWGVLIAIGGAVTVVLSAKTSETKMGPDDLWHSIKRWEFLTYIGITLVLIVLLMIASPRYGKRTILIDLGLVGLFGGYTALSTKGVASMISGSLFQALTFPITYPLILVLVTSAVMQIRYINRALSNFASTQVIPTQFVLFTLSVIIGSAVLYRDFEKTDVDHVVKFIVGCFLTFSGVWLITSGRRSGDDHGDDDDDGTHDETIHLIDEEAEEENERTPTKREHMAQINTAVDTPKALQRETTDNSVSQPSPSPSTPAMSVTTYDDPLKQNPWASSSENLGAKARPATPPNIREAATAETPFFTPSSAPATKRLGRIGILDRMETSPADPQTPTRANRAPSPPKPDLPALAPGEAYPTPQSNIFTSARGSISRLLPGPFLGALSSGSLNTVVAESLLRGEGSPGGPTRARTYGRRSRPIQTTRLERNRRRSATGISSIEGADLENGLTTPLLSRWQTHETRPAGLDRHHSDQFYNTTEAQMEGSNRTGFLPSLSPTLSKFMSIMKERGKDKANDQDPDSGQHEEDSSSRKSSYRR